MTSAPPAGAYAREASAIRGRIGADAFPAEAGRYRLYVSYACPWAHRTLLALALLGLEAAIRVTAVEPVMDDVGWRLLDGGGHLIDVYRTLHHADYVGRATVPLLVDDRAGVAVSNDSSDIARMLDEAFAPTGVPPRLCPPRHAAAIGALNDRLHAGLNDGVYRVGFARSAKVREAAMAAVRATLDEMEARLAAGRRFLVEDAAPLEPDWRLWATLVRWEPAYRPFVLGPGAPALDDFPALSRLTAELVAWPGVVATLRPGEIVAHFSARAAVWRAE